jgi:hypothetical protein
VLALKSIIIGHTARERYSVTLKALKGTNKDLWQREVNSANATLMNALTAEQVKENLFAASLDRLTDHVVKDEYAVLLQVH